MPGISGQLPQMVRIIAFDARLGKTKGQAGHLYSMNFTDYEHDIFFKLKRPTIANIRAALEWAQKHAIKTEIDYLDCSKSFSRQPSDMVFKEAMKLIDKKSVPFFRIILRKNYNWFGILTNDKHTEDILEIGLRSIEIDQKEIFVFCYLKKELLSKMSKKFAITQIH